MNQIHSLISRNFSTMMKMNCLIEFDIEYFQMMIVLVYGLSVGFRKNQVQMSNGYHFSQEIFFRNKEVLKHLNL